jgi:hypothetical protein
LAALCGLTAVQRLGVFGFTCEAIHVLVTKGARVLPVEGVTVKVHESRRFTKYDVLPRLPPVTGIERSTIDAAVWAPDVKTAIRLVVAPVQQRFASAAPADGLGGSRKGSVPGGAVDLPC